MIRTCCWDATLEPRRVNPKAADAMPDRFEADPVTSAMATMVSVAGTAYSLTPIAPASGPCTKAPSGSLDGLVAPSPPPSHPSRR
jgi:hypothetical protein